MEIRYLSDDPAEISTLAGWIYDEWGRANPSRTPETAREKALQSAGRTEPPLTLVCYVDGEMVGTASVDTADMSTHPELTPWMASVYVVPERRGRGIGTALCTRVIDELKRLGVGTAYLYTPDQEKLYQGLGWKTILREEYRGEPVVIMRLDLD